MVVITVVPAGVLELTVLAEFESEFEAEVDEEACKD